MYECLFVVGVFCGGEVVFIKYELLVVYCWILIWFKVKIIGENIG